MTIQDFSEIKPGHAFRGQIVHDPHGRFCIIFPGDIRSEGTIRRSSVPPVRTDVRSTRILATGDVLIATRSRFAAAVFHQVDTEEWTVPSSILILTVTDPAVLPDYVATYINSAPGQHMFKRYQEETTVPYISAAKLAKMHIPVPALEEQQALIAYNNTTRRMARLTRRKQKLQQEILDHELATLGEGQQ